jgi:hypothetical protein
MQIPRNPCDGVRLPKRTHADRGYLSHAHAVALAATVDCCAGGERVAVGHRVGRSCVEHAKDLGAAFRVIPGLARRRDGGDDDQQGP